MPIFSVVVRFAIRYHPTRWGGTCLFTDRYLTLPQPYLSLGLSVKYTTCFASLALTAYILPMSISRLSIASALGMSSLWWDRDLTITYCPANSVALYGLLLFYGLTKEELVGRRPLAKFLCIKLIVVFTFYQSFIVSPSRLCGRYPLHARVVCSLAH